MGMKCAGPPCPNRIYSGGALNSVSLTRDGKPLWTQAELQDAMTEALYKQGLLTEQQRRDIRQRLGCDMADYRKEG